MTAPIYSDDHKHIYKNVEVSRKFGVSEVTVLNWIRAAKQSRNNLEVVEHRGKMHILDTAENIAEIKLLCERGRKYRNKPALKRVTIDNLDIRQDHYHELLHSLQNFKRIPFKISFSKQPKDHWETFYRDDTVLDPYLLQSKLLIQDCYTVWLSHFPRNSELNLVFSGYTSPYVYRNLIEEVREKRPIANIKWIFPTKEAEGIFLKENAKWLENIPEEINYYTFVADIECDPLWSVLTKEPSESNVIFLLGEIFFNHKYTEEVIRNFNRALTKGDLLVGNILLDQPEARTTFEGFTHQRIEQSVYPLLNELELKYKEDYVFNYEFFSNDPTKKWFQRRGSKSWSLITQKEIEFDFKFGAQQKTIIWPKETRIELSDWKLWDDNLTLEYSKLRYQIVSFNTNAERTQCVILAQRQ